VSIIEKAVSRLGQRKAEATTPSMPIAGTPVDFKIGDANRMDNGITKQDGLSNLASTATLVSTSDTVTRNSAKKVSAPSVHAIKQVEINLERLAAKNMVTSGSGRNPVAEEFRVIKRPLIDNAFSKDGRSVNRNNLIMVTSALPGEGKTFTAINLAISIAMELDHTVLLVDADVARPSVLRTLGLKAEAGLMDLLLNAKTDVSDVLLKTNIDTLSILPAGKSHRNATELLASQTMSSLLDEIASRYPDRIVIFDSPPLLLTSEARVLASQMGQIVVVVEAETTTVHAVKNALGQLESCSNVNLVYNKAKSFPGQESYGYYYG
jgi:protein-tyrosine kinase